MASGLGGIFDQGKQQGPAMAAPGIPAGALSGNPVASFVNVGMATGANVGANLVGALGGLAGLPQANPAMMVQQRQQEFANTFQQIQADGSVMNGQALKMAAEKQYKAGRLAPNEYLTAIAEANKQIEIDRDRLTKTTDFVNKSETVKDYIETQNRFKQLVNLANDPTSNPNDFVLIQQGLKVLDPGSITSQGEINSAKMTAKGRLALDAALGDIGSSLSGMMQFQAGKGEMLTLTANQKAKWIKAIARAVDGQRDAAASVYLQGRDAFVAGGGSENIYRKGLQHTLDALQYTADAAAAEATYSPGTGSDSWWGLSERAKQNSAQVGDKLGGAAADIGEIYVRMGVSSVGRTLERAGDWLGDATQSARDLFSFGASASDAAGAATTFADDEYKVLNQSTIGTGSTILDQAVDIGNGGHNAKAIMHGVVDGAESGIRPPKRKKRKLRGTSGGF